MGIAHPPGRAAERLVGRNAFEKPVNWGHGFKSLSHPPAKPKAREECGGLARESDFVVPEEDDLVRLQVSPEIPTQCRHRLARARQGARDVPCAKIEFVSKALTKGRR